MVPEGQLAQHRQMGRGWAGDADRAGPHGVGGRRPNRCPGGGGHRGHPPLVAFRLFAPNEIFPVAYRRGRSAHLDVGGTRGAAIRRGLEDQLGLAVED